MCVHYILSLFASLFEKTGIGKRKQDREKSVEENEVINENGIKSSWE